MQSTSIQPESEPNRVLKHYQMLVRAVKNSPVAQVWYLCHVHTSHFSSAPNEMVAHAGNTPASPGYQPGALFLS